MWTEFSLNRVQLVSYVFRVWSKCPLRRILKRDQQISGFVEREAMPQKQKRSFNSIRAQLLLREPWALLSFVSAFPLSFSFFVFSSGYCRLTSSISSPAYICERWASAHDPWRCRIKPLWYLRLNFFNFS